MNGRFPSSCFDLVPAVRSGKGRLLYGALVLATFAVVRWVPDPVASVLAIVDLTPVGFLIIAADERKRSREFYGGDGDPAVSCFGA